MYDNGAGSAYYDDGQQQNYDMPAQSYGQQPQQQYDYGQQASGGQYGGGYDSRAAGGYQQPQQAAGGMYGQPGQAGGATAMMRSELDTLAAAGGYPNASRLLRDAIEREEAQVPVNPEYLDLADEPQVRIVRKIAIPTDRHPRFNFVGKILGPGGKTLQALSNNHGCKIFIFGKGSMRNEDKEMELLGSGDPKYKHFEERLHLKVETVGAPEEVYKKLGELMVALKPYLEPVRDEIVDSQMAAMGDRGEGGGERGRGRGRGGPGRGRGGGFTPRGGRGGSGYSRGGSGFGGGGSGGFSSPGQSSSYGDQSQTGSSGIVSYPQHYYAGAQSAASNGQDGATPGGGGRMKRGSRFDSRKPPY